MRPAAMFEAMKLKYEAEMADAYARMTVYFENAVAIGEHPQHTEEIDKLLEQYSCANDKCEVLHNLFDKDGTPGYEKASDAWTDFECDEEVSSEQ